MRLFAPSLAFVDLETTGTTAAKDAITEVAIVRVDGVADAAPSIDEWSTLVDPGVPIPPAIQALTGITDQMVRSAPTFSTVARDVLERTAGAIFIAHNARFDYGFLKHAFARLERTFSARVLCTVKLSRRLYPDCDGHSLDQLIARHAIDVRERHRALADARALWAFVQALYRDHPSDAIELAVRRAMKTPSLPPQLAADAIDALPETPGVYRFYGLNTLPLYIGKAKNLRERIGAHFSSDYRSSTDLRLSAEIRRIEIDETAGEIGALLREAALVKALLPAHNHALRRKAQSGVLEIADEPGPPPRYLPAAGIEPSQLAGRYGPFSSRRAAQQTLRGLAAENRLCWVMLGLERRSGPCFARQIRRCAGCCIGAESPAAHDARLRAALAPFAIPTWPVQGPALLREPAALGARVDVHVLRDWCWLGTAQDETELGALLEAPSRPTFDPDITRLLIRLHARKRLALRSVAAATAMAP